MSKLTNLVLHIQAALEEQSMMKEELVEIPPKKEAAKVPVEVEHPLTKKNRCWRLFSKEATKYK